MTALLSLAGVSLAYGSQAVLSATDIDVAGGEVLALLGPSGSGKTSVLRVLLGFAVPSEGIVRIGEQVVTQGGRIAVAPEDRGLAVVFQDLALWPHLSVAGNLGFGLAAKGVPRSERADRTAEILRRVGLAGFEGRQPHALSGGQRQRVAIARALVARPRAVLLDEPLANVDVDLRRDLLALLRELLRDTGATAIHVTHDLREAIGLAHRFAVMESGRVVQEGSLGHLRQSPATPFVESLLEDLDGPISETSGARSAPARRSS